MRNFKTEQEKFWAEEFGNDYIKRNQGKNLLASNLKFFTKAGHTDRLFKMDFAGEFIDKFINTVLVDYGFAYKRDIAFPQDDITWFLLEKE